MNAVNFVCRKINKQRPDRYTILTYPTHEGYQTLLDKTGHNFLMFNRPGTKEWDTRFRPVPDNHSIVNEIRDTDDIDFILSQQRFDQLGHAMKLSQLTRLPIVHLEHVEPWLDRWSQEEFDNLRSLTGDINVFITHHNKSTWGFGNDPFSFVIPHGIDTDLFQGWSFKNRTKKKVLYVVNQLQQRDYFCGFGVWEAVKSKVKERDPNIEFILVGDNPGYSTTPPSTEHLVNEYRDCDVYINTSQVSPIPMSLLEAMSCGCPIVSSAKQEIPRIVSEEKQNGFISNNVDELVDKVIQLCHNKDMANAYSEKARNTVMKMFSLDQFVGNWNRIFDMAYSQMLGKTLHA